MGISRKDHHTKICEKHINNFEEYICLDPECLISSRSCFLCLKNNHNTCKDELILPIEQFEKSSDFFYIEIPNQHIIKEINGIFDKIQAELDTVIHDLKKSTIDKITQMHYDIVDRDLNYIEKIKKKLHLSFDPTLNKIRISFDPLIYEDSINRIIEKFKFDLDEHLSINLEELNNLQMSADIKTSINQNNNYNDDISNIKKQFMPLVLCPKNWIHHPNLSIDNFFGGLMFKRSGQNFHTDYFCALLDQPLQTNFRFKITIYTICEINKRIAFGIIDESKFNFIKKNKMINYYYTNDTMIVFTGTSKTGNLIGKIPTDIHYEKNALKPGDYFYMDFVPQQHIKFYNENGTLDLYRDLKNTNENFYLYVDLPFFHASFVMELI